MQTLTVFRQSEYDAHEARKSNTEYSRRFTAVGMNSRSGGRFGTHTRIHYEGTTAVAQGEYSADSVLNTFKLGFGSGVKTGVRSHKAPADTVTLDQAAARIHTRGRMVSDATGIAAPRSPSSSRSPSKSPSKRKIVPLDSFGDGVGVSPPRKHPPPMENKEQAPSDARTGRLDVPRRMSKEEVRDVIFHEFGRNYSGSSWLSRLKNRRHHQYRADDSVENPLQEEVSEVLQTQLDDKQTTWSPITQAILGRGRRGRGITQSSIAFAENGSPMGRKRPHSRTLSSSKLKGSGASSADNEAKPDEAAAPVKAEQFKITMSSVRAVERGEAEALVQGASKVASAPAANTSSERRRVGYRPKPKVIIATSRWFTNLVPLWKYCATVVVLSGAELVCGVLEHVAGEAGPCQAAKSEPLQTAECRLVPCGSSGSHASNVWRYGPLVEPAISCSTSWT